MKTFFRSDLENTFKEFSINLHPTQDYMNRAYKVRKILSIQTLHLKVISISKLVFLVWDAPNIPEYVDIISLEEYE